MTKVKPNIVQVSNSWHKAFPKAIAGTLVMRKITNSENHSTLKRLRARIEQNLKEQFSNKTKENIKQQPVIQAYRRHYKKFDKSYHVRLQLESVVFKGRSYANSNSLVEAMFIAELKNLMLTAGHDLNFVDLPVIFEASTGKEIFQAISGKEQRLRPEDMIMKDSEGIICSVIYGPDSRTRIRPNTEKVMFTVYAPNGISREQVLEHLKDIKSNVLLFSPSAKTELLEIF